MKFTIEMGKDGLYRAMLRDAHTNEVQMVACINQAFDVPADAVAFAKEIIRQFRINDPEIQMNGLTWY